MSDTDPDTSPPPVHTAEVDAAYWVLWEAWKLASTSPPNSAAIREALAAAKQAMKDRQ